jgi:NADPH:quinone reductase
VLASSFGGPEVLAVETVPDPVAGLPEAAALLHDGATALGLAESTGIRPGEWALVVGADYSEPDWPQEVLAATAGIRPDVVFDGAGTQLGQAAFAITADGGRFSAHGSPSGGFAVIDAEEARRRDITVRGIEQVQFTPDQLQALAARAVAEAAAGRIRPVIGQTFPLDQAAAAHAAIENRSATGKTLLLTS